MKKKYDPNFSLIDNYEKQELHSSINNIYFILNIYQTLLHNILKWLYYNEIYELSLVIEQEMKIYNEIYEKMIKLIKYIDDELSKKNLDGGTYFNMYMKNKTTYVKFIEDIYYKMYTKNKKNYEKICSINKL